MNKGHLDNIALREQLILKKRYHRISREHIREIISSIKNGKGRILEVGCGHADVAVQYVAAHCSELIITDLEPSFDVTKLPSNVLFKKQDATKLTFEDESFDGIYSVEVIEHVANPEDFIQEGLRVLKPGGTLFFTTPNRHRLTALARWLVLKPLRFPHTYAIDPVLGPITHEREYSFSEINELLSKFEVSESEIKGIFLGVPLLDIGIGKPPKPLDRFAFNWHVRMVK